MESVEQFSEFDWNKESTLVTVFELFTSLFSLIRSGSDTGVIGVRGAACDSNCASFFGSKLPLKGNKLMYKQRANYENLPVDILNRFPQLKQNKLNNCLFVAIKYFTSFNATTPTNRPIFVT